MRNFAKETAQNWNGTAQSRRKFGRSVRAMTTEILADAEVPTSITADAKDFLRLADDLRAIHVWAPTLR